MLIAEIQGHKIFASRGINYDSLTAAGSSIYNRQVAYGTSKLANILFRCAYYLE